MPCPLCGDICRCSSDAPSAAPPRWLADGDAHLAAAPPQPKADAPRADAATLGPAVEAAASADSNEPACSARRDEDEDSDAWRQEVAARLNRYQARHKPRPPRYPSLRLPFEKDAAPAVDMDSSPIEPPSFPRRMTPASNRALALDEFADIVSDAVEADPIAGPAPSLALPHAQASPEAKTEDKPQPAAPATAKGKIIEFPRFWTPAPPPLDELAEPVFDRDRPRILEAPEVVPPLPALGGITIEPAQRPEVEKRPGIDIPLQTASLARRIFPPPSTVSSSLRPEFSSPSFSGNWRRSVHRDSRLSGSPPGSPACSGPLTNTCFWFIRAPHRDCSWRGSNWLASMAALPAAGSAAGASSLHSSQPLLSAWDTPGSSSTKTRSAGTIASRTPTSRRRARSQQSRGILPTNL